MIGLGITYGNWKISAWDRRMIRRTTIGWTITFYQAAELLLTAEETGDFCNIVITGWRPGDEDRARRELLRLEKMN